MRRSANATDPALRARAVEIARKHGAAEAAKQTGVKAATIRGWLHRQAKAAEPVTATSSGESDEVETLERLAKAVRPSLFGRSASEGTDRDAIILIAHTPAPDV